MTSKDPRPFCIMRLWFVRDVWPYFNFFIDWLIDWDLCLWNQPHKSKSRCIKSTVSSVAIENNKNKTGKRQQNERKNEHKKYQKWVQIGENREKKKTSENVAKNFKNTHKKHDSVVVLLLLHFVVFFHMAISQQRFFGRLSAREIDFVSSLISRKRCVRDCCIARKNDVNKTIFWIISRRRLYDDVQVNGGPLKLFRFRFRRISVELDVRSQLIGRR